MSHLYRDIYIFELTDRANEIHKIHRKRMQENKIALMAVFGSIQCLFFVCEYSNCLLFIQLRSFCKLFSVTVDTRMTSKKKINWRQISSEPKWTFAHRPHAYMCAGACIITMYMQLSSTRRLQWKSSGIIYMFFFLCKYLRILRPAPRHIYSPRNWTFLA